MMSASNTLVTKSFNPVDHAKTKSIDKTSESIIKWTPISDLAGEPIAWLKTQTKREHYSKGNTLFIYLFATVGVVASAIATSTFSSSKKGGNTL